MSENKIKIEAVLKGFDEMDAAINRAEQALQNLKEAVAAISQIEISVEVKEGA